MPTVNKVPVDLFLPAVADGQPVLSVLGLTLADFTPDSFEKLLENAHDVGRGVTAVSRKSNMLFFGLFDQVEAKQYGDGGVQYIFTGTTRDVAAITHIVQLLRQALGQGAYDDAEHCHFDDTNALTRLAGSKWLPPGKTMLQVCPGKYVTCTLCYSSVSRHKLLLAVHQKPESVLDVAVRAKGTIADLLRFNLHEVLLQPELRREIELKEGTLRFVSYDFQLREPELGMFDLVKVRIFGPERALQPDVAINLTLTCSQPPSFEAKLRAVEQLIRLYGADHLGLAELRPREVEELAGRWWGGRTWSLDEHHAAELPGKSSSEGYTLDISMHGAANFEITIFGYQSLIYRFTAQ
jgi:hypothetical protein